jgi:hypothetical protein
VDAVRVDVRVVGDEVDGVRVQRPRLHAAGAEQLAGGVHAVERAARADGLDHRLVRRDRGVLPEPPHRLRRLAQAYRRADLRGVAAVAGGDLHDHDVAVGEPAGARPRVAEDHRRVGHRRRADDQEVDLAAAVEDRVRRGRRELVLGHAGRGPLDERLHGRLAEPPGGAHAVELLLAVDDEQLVHDPVGQDELGVRELAPQRGVLVDGEVVAVARVDLEQPDPAALEPELADPLGHHVRVAAAAARADVRERGGRGAPDGLDVRPAHGVDQRRVALERDDHVRGERVPLPVAGQPQHPAAEAPVARAAGHDRAVEAELAHLRPQRGVAALVLLR